MGVPRVSLVLGTAAFILALLAGTRAWQAHFRTEPVLRVRQDLPAGVPLDAAAVETVRVPLGARPAGALADPAALAGQYARVPLVPGEYLLPGHLTATAPPKDLAQHMADGARILSIPVRPEAALQGALKAGDLVDAYAAYPAAEGKAGSVQPLARALPVMDVRNSEGAPTAAAAREGAPGRAVPAAVLLEVTPAQAETILTALQNNGQVFLLLAGRVGR